MVSLTMVDLALMSSNNKIKKILLSAVSRGREEGLNSEKTREGKERVAQLRFDETKERVHCRKNDGRGNKQANRPKKCWNGLDLSSDL